jgi:hypothetical protein
LTGSEWKRVFALVALVPIIDVAFVINNRIFGAQASQRLRREPAECLANDGL